MENIQNLSMDIMDNHIYETAYAKQFDSGRELHFTVMENGQSYDLTEAKVDFQMKKPDGTVILKPCHIENNKIVVTLDKNSTACYGNRIPFQLQLTNLEKVITTATGHIKIDESVVKMDDIESTSDFTTFNDILIEISAKHEESKAFAESAKESEAAAAESEKNALESAAEAANSATTSGTKATEAANSASAAATSETHAKASETNAASSASSASTSATAATQKANAALSSATEAANSAAAASGSATTATAKATAASNSASAAKASETNAKASENNAAESKNAAANSASAAKTSETNSKTSEANAKTSEINAKSSADNAKTSETNAASSKTSAASSATSASNSATTATTKATESSSYATQSKSYAVGGTGTRTNENIDNSKYYYEQSKAISESFSGALRPMGTVSFANLPTLSGASEGDMYNISDQFTTTSDFKEGSGLVIPAGANVYKTADGKWDVLAGTPVTGVKGNAENSYRKGNVNITPANIGLGNVGNFKAVSTVASQGLSDTEKSNARSNIGAGTSSFSGSYNDLANKPSIPTIPASLPANGGNADTVDGKHASDLQNYNNLTNKPTIPETSYSTITLGNKLKSNGGLGNQYCVKFGNFVFVHLCFQTTQAMSGSTENGKGDAIAELEYKPSQTITNIASVTKTGDIIAFKAEEGNKPLRLITSSVASGIKVELNFAYICQN